MLDFPLYCPCASSVQPQTMYYIIGAELVEKLTLIPVLCWSKADWLFFFFVSCGFHSGIVTALGLYLAPFSFISFECQRQ